MLGVLGGVASAQDGDPAHGEQVYAAQKCAMCHSIAGKGQQKGPLDDVGSRLSAEEIRLWIVDAKMMTAKTNAARKPPMRTYKLEKADLDDLVSFLQTLKAP
jgi:mono/diheme cytochrome c family protein